MASHLSANVLAGFVVTDKNLPIKIEHMQHIYKAITKAAAPVCLPSVCLTTFNVVLFVFLRPLNSRDMAVDHLLIHYC